VLHHGRASTPSHGGCRQLATARSYLTFMYVLCTLYSVASRPPVSPPLQGHPSRAGQGVEDQCGGGLPASRHTALRQVRQRQVLLRRGEQHLPLLVYRTHVDAN
jgi:hypothetical protein